MVWTFPEHDGGLDSPRARWWSGKSPSTRNVAKNHMPLVPFFYSVKSNLTRLVTKVGGYSTSYCLLVLSSKQSLGTYKEVRQCGPSHTGNKEAHTLITKRRIYWHRSRGCENNHLRRVRTSPKNLRRTKRWNSRLFII